MPKSNFPSSSFHVCSCNEESSSIGRFAFHISLFTLAERTFLANPSEISIAISKAEASFFTFFTFPSDGYLSIIIYMLAKYKIWIFNSE